MSRQSDRRKDFRKPLDRSDAIAIATEEGLPRAESVFGVPFSPAPVSVGRVEVGWLIQFAPVRQFDDDGRKLMHVQYIVDDVDRDVHSVGTPGVQRAVARIKGEGEFR